MLTAMWHMLKNEVAYHDLDTDHFTRRDRFKAILRLVRRLNDLACDVKSLLSLLKSVVIMQR
jgi:hypothetical protein